MSIFVNEYDLGLLVYMISSLDGHLAPSVMQRDTLALASSAGRWSTQVKIDPRQITVGLDVRPATLAARQTIMDSLSRRLSGDLEIRTADLPTRFVRARLANIAVELYPGSFAQSEAFVTLTFTAPDPARVDLEPLVYGLSTARTPCPVGAMTSAPMVWIYGACTNPELVVRNVSGTEVMRTTFTVVLGATESLVIDAATQQVQRITAGVVQTGALSGLTAFTSGRFPVLSPEDATPDGTAWPTVELVASAGTPTGLTVYHRRW
jgi:phage-related protein